MIKTSEILNSIPEKKEKLTLETILNRTSEYDIYKKYIGDFKIGKPIKSPFRSEKTPSFYFYISKSGRLRYNDFGDSDMSGGVVDFVGKLYNLSNYNDILVKISEDMNIPNLVDLPGHWKTRNSYEFKEKHIAIRRQKFSDSDLKYFSTYGIDNKETLEKFNVSAIAYYTVDGRLVDSYKIDNPIYAYKVFSNFRIYKPLDIKYKRHRGNLSSLDIIGYEQLPQNGDLLIITKSAKDVMALYELGYSAIAPPSESAGIADVVSNNLKERFKKIVVLFDKDKTGVLGTLKLVRKYGFDFAFMPKIYIKDGIKDISDFIKVNGKNKCKYLLKKLIKT